MHSEQNFSFTNGTVISEVYEIESPVMLDECSEMYRVKHAISKIALSLKILRGSAVNDKTSILRFQFEAKALTSCAHKAVARVYDFGVFENASYLVVATGGR